MQGTIAVTVRIMPFGGCVSLIASNGFKVELHCGRDAVGDGLRSWVGIGQPRSRLGEEINLRA
jgi:hypothetical protein